MCDVAHDATRDAAQEVGLAALVSICWRRGSVITVLLLHSKVAMFPSWRCESELSEHHLRATTFVLRSCDFVDRAATMLFAYCFGA